MAKEQAELQPWDAESVKQELMRAIAAEAYCRELGRWGVGASGSVIDAAKRMEWLGFLEPGKTIYALQLRLGDYGPSRAEKSDRVADARCEAALQEIAEQLNWSGQPRRLGFQRHKPGDERAGKRVPPRSRRRADDPSHGAVTREALDVASYIMDVTAQVEAVAITAPPLQAGFPSRDGESRKRKNCSDHQRPPPSVKLEPLRPPVTGHGYTVHGRNSGLRGRPDLPRHFGRLTPTSCSPMKVAHRELFRC